jgi:hypothetical protein
MGAAPLARRTPSLSTRARLTLAATTSSSSRKGEGPSRSSRRRSPWRPHTEDWPLVSGHRLVPLLSSCHRPPPPPSLDSAKATGIKIRGGTHHPPVSPLPTTEPRDGSSKEHERGDWIRWSMLKKRAFVWFVFLSCLI